jgi:hypothetical protein
LAILVDQADQGDRGVGDACRELDQVIDLGLGIGIEDGAASEQGEALDFAGMKGRDDHRCQYNRQSTGVPVAMEMKPRHCRIVHPAFGGIAA